MLIQCNNRGCMKTCDAKYDTKTKEVICTECGKPITNISESMKRVLYSAGQIVRDNEDKKFVLGCRSCNANRAAVFDDTTNAVVCSNCKTEMKVHTSMKIAIKEHGEHIKTAAPEPEPVAAKKTKKKVVKKKATNSEPSEDAE